MTTITLRPDLVRKVQEIAEQESRSIEQVLENMLTHYQPASTPEHSETGLQRLAAFLKAQGDVEWNGPHDLSERTKEYLETEYTDYLMKRMASPADDADSDERQLVALAERLNLTQVCTFDRRDFNLIRPRHCDHLDLLPQ